MSFPRFISFLILIFANVFALKAASIDDAFQSLSEFNYFEAKKQFEKSFKKNYSAANYGLALIYYRTDNPFHNLDSAYSCIVRSEQTYGLMKDKQKESLKKHQFDYHSLALLRQAISTAQFELIKNKPTEEGLDLFVRNHAWAKEYSTALYMRDSIAFSKAKTANTANAFDLFLKKYPTSEFQTEALNLFHQNQYKENTSAKTITSFLNFEKQFPSNPYVSDAQDQVYHLSTAQNRVKDYHLFIKTYPSNRNVETAWRKLYQIYMSDYSLKRLDKFQQEFPDYPFSEELIRDRELGMQQLIPYKKEGKFGWMDLSGKIVIPAQYTTVGFFKEGLAWAEKGGKYGFVNKANEVVIPFKYTSCNDFDKGRAIVELDTVYGIIDRSGANIVDPVYKDIGQFSEGLIYAMKDSLYGYFDGMGYPRISAQFQEAFSFSKGMAKVMIQDLEGFIDTYGTYKVKPMFETVSIFSDSLILVEDDEEELRLANYNGDFIKTLPIEEIGPLVNDRALVISNDKIGYLNGKGQTVIAPSYDYFTNAKSEGEFVGNYAKVSKANKFGIIDRSGKALIPCAYSKLGAVSTLVSFEKAGKWGYLDLTNKMAIPLLYEYAESFKNGVGIVQDMTLRGGINSKGQVIIPIEFTSVKVLDDTHFLVVLGALHGVYTNKGELVVPVEYGNIRKVQDDYYLLTKGQEMHYFYAPENKLIKPQF